MINGLGLTAERPLETGVPYELWQNDVTELRLRHDKLITLLGASATESKINKLPPHSNIDYHLTHGCFSFDAGGGQVRCPVVYSNLAEGPHRVSLKIFADEGIPPEARLAIEDAMTDLRPADLYL